MSRAMGRVLAVTLSACLMLCHTTTAFAMEPEQPEDEIRVCETIDDLLAELEKDIGGTIGLSGDGPFIMDSYARIFVTQPVTVSLPPNGIEIAEDTTISGPVTFTGTLGFSVRDYALLSLYDGVSIQMEQSDGVAPVAVSLLGAGWQLDADSSVTLCAQGDHATAIFSLNDTVLRLGYARVCAIGYNAQAISCLGELVVEKAFIEVEGDAAFAIRSQSLAELLLVSVNGAVEADEVYGVLSYFSHPPENLIDLPAAPNKTPKRTVVYQNLVCGSSPIDFYDENSYQYWYRMPYMWRDSHVNVECAITWDLGGLDYSIPGEYTATGILRPIMEIPLLPDFTITHEITVVPPNRVAICDSRNWGGYAWVGCLAPIREADDILLWIYEEENGWRELTANAQANYRVEDSSFEVFGLDTEQYYWVVVQVVGGSMAGFSNLWLISFDDEIGGDRTGTDRYGTKPTTLPPTLNTDSGPPGDGGTGGEGTGEDGDGSEPSGNDGESGNNGAPSGGGGNTSQGGNLPKGTDHTIGGESDKDTVQPVPTDVPAIKTTEQVIPAFEPVRAAPSAQAPKADSNPKTNDTPALHREPETMEAQTDREHPSDADAPLVYDPEQSAPEPGFPANTLTVVFLSVAALGVGALFVLRPGVLGRWRRGKP